MLTRVASVAIAGLALVAAACSSTGDSEPQAGIDLKQQGELGGITVEATWLTEQTLGDAEADVSSYPLDDFVLFAVGLDTHSGDLGEIDLKEASLLRQSGQELAPEAWLSTSDDSHHRAGVLVFPRRLENGPVELALDHEEHQLALRWEGAP